MSWHAIGVYSAEKGLLPHLKRTISKAGDADITFVNPSELVPRPQFSAEKYFEALSTKVFGQTLLPTSSLPSTQTLLHQHFAEFPDGTICVADTQTHGKGRSSNTWVSPMGCLMFSAYRQLDISGQLLPFVQYVVSLAIVHAIKKVCEPSMRGSDLDVRIKWPNDIYVDNLKIGGILCQSVYRGGSFHVIIGVGLNVNNAKPTTCLSDIVQGLRDSESEGKDGISREILLAEIANELELLLTELTKHGFTNLKPQYLASWLHSGQKIVLEEQGLSGPQKVALVITDISDTGYLVAVDDSQEIYELHPDGNSLDFFAALIRRKPMQTRSEDKQ